MKTFTIAATVSLALAIAGCSKPSPSRSSEQGANAPSAEAQREAADIVKNRCTPCHGPTGHGDGPASASLNPKPRNWTDKEWQKIASDEEIEKAITYGGAAVGKSAAMPANPDLQSKPEVVKALRMTVRSFGK